MALKLLEHNSEPHAGYGAGWGTIDTYVYECPCGKGKVIKTTSTSSLAFRSRLFFQFSKSFIIVCCISLLV